MIISHNTCHKCLSVVYVVLAALTLFGETATVAHAAAELLAGAIYLLMARLDGPRGPSATPPTG
jgi:hypothetical protein